ncbi:hypothetical protein [Thermus scotoductus]|uniref:hypothetical protein n=1 Tax=Thermus scotoductus TaxID=37636 RepID=UPI0020A4E5E4|nr:hypothetical protein [Thermus scotoductus]
MKVRVVRPARHPLRPQGLPARDTTVFLVGEALRAKRVRSRLYDPDFQHRFRR